MASDDELRAQAQADGAAALTEAATREQAMYDLMIEDKQADVTLTMAHAGVQFAKADFLKAMAALTSVTTVLGIVAVVTALVKWWA